VEGVEVGVGKGREEEEEGEEEWAARVDRGETSRRRAVERYRRVEREGGGVIDVLESVIGGARGCREWVEEEV